MEEKVRSLLMIVLGNLLITSAYTLFAIPNNIVDGGVTSTALLLSYYFDSNLTYTICGLTFIILVLSYTTFGKRFFLKTLFSNLCYVTFFSFFSWVGVAIVTSTLNSILIAGVFIGLGHYLCLKEKSATLGYDAVALFLHKLNKKLPTTCILWLICSVVLLLGATFFGIKIVIMGIMLVFIETQIIYWCSNKGQEF